MANLLRTLLKGLIPSACQPPAAAERFLTKLKRNNVIGLGPFTGMRFSWDQVFSPPLPKFLGTYEMELLPVLDKLFPRKFGTVIDVGAAEGYYAVGFALKFPSAQVIAYEVLEEGQKLVTQLSLNNHVNDRVTVKGLCADAALQNDITDNTLVMMDVEGAEDILLDPVAVPALKQATLLFESHDALVEGVGQRVCARFAATHYVTAVPSRPRTLADWPQCYGWQKRYLRYFVTGWMVDRANPTVWYLLEPKQPSA